MCVMMNANFGWNAAVISTTAKQTKHFVAAWGNSVYTKIVECFRCTLKRLD